MKRTTGIQPRGRAVLGRDGGTAHTVEHRARLGNLDHGDQADAAIDLPPALRNAARSADRAEDATLEPLSAVEKHHIGRVLERTGWNKTRSARILGISKPTLYAKIKNYGLTQTTDPD